MKRKKKRKRLGGFKSKGGYVMVSRKTRENVLRAQLMLPSPTEQNLHRTDWVA